MTTAMTMDAAMSQAASQSTNQSATGISAQLPSTRPLWAAIGILGISVLAMGATLVHIKQRPIEPSALMPSMNYLASPADTASEGKSKDAAMITEMADDKADAASVVGTGKSNTAAAKTVVKPNVPTKVAALQKPAPVAADKTTNSAPQSEQVAAVAQPVAQAKQVCANCGTVEAVNAVTREGHGSGVGVVAGGVLGGVLGNQVGGGNGRTVATVLGAVGGGWAGNKIEKNMKKDTVYNVRVRMEDGSTRTLQQASAPGVGAKVTVDGNTLRADNGAVYVPAPERRAKPVQTASTGNISQTNDR
jgi:outer membrane lipoprotein SlyB